MTSSGIVAPETGLCDEDAALLGPMGLKQHIQLENVMELDKELEMASSPLRAIDDGGTRGTRTDALKRHLARLEDEARSLGLDPEEICFDLERGSD